MTEYWTITEIAAHFGITDASARKLLSDNAITHVRVYPVDQVKQIPRPGQGRRTDLQK